MTRANPNGVRAGEFEIGQTSPERARAANEVGAAIVHQLNGPLTALLLYVGDLSQNSDRFPAANGDGQSLKRVVESVLRETEHICFLLQRIGEAFEAPLQNETAIAHGREILMWWSRVGNRNGGDTKAQAARSIQKLLTPREHEVLLLICEGCSNKEGGLRMQISFRTFESHRANAMRKFGARNVADLIRLSLLNFESFNSDRSATTVGA
jgi:DNA-binding CsgD family transcriptional regulator